MHHFKAVAERLKEELEKGLWEKLIVGCHDSNWSEFESHLHPYVRQRLLGHFSTDVANVSTEQIREQASRILREALDERRQTLVKEVLDQAKSNNRGITGVRRVLRSLELGEVQTLFLGENFSARAVECTNCGHLDSHMVPYCVVCDAIVPAAIRRDVELFYVKNDPEFDRVGNIAALLRFRADQNRSGEISAAS